MHFLTANGETFIAPQYELEEGWRCPDFVALRPGKKQVWVVQASASGYPLALVDQINQRDARWYAPLLAQLQRLGIIGGDWSIGVLVFVRDDQIHWLQTRIQDRAGVHVLSLETASSPWTWHDSVWTPALNLDADAIPRKDSAPDKMHSTTTH